MVSNNDLRRESKNIIKRVKIEFKKRGYELGEDISSTWNVRELNIRIDGEDEFMVMIQPQIISRQQESLLFHAILHKRNGSEFELDKYRGGGYSDVASYKNMTNVKEFVEKCISDMVAEQL